MADSKRLMVLKALTTHLEGITTVAGYQFTLTGRVYRGRTTFGDEAEFPCVSILEPLNPDREPFGAGNDVVQKELWALLIQGWTPKVDLTNHMVDDAHNLMADVKKRLAMLIDDGHVPLNSPLLNLGGLINHIKLEPGTVRESDFPNAQGMFYIRAVLDISEDLTDPYKV